ncbi:MAG: carboxymuconolactone decarboxylase family protein [Hydrogenophaga sp.]|jgi:uncharacterized peroxidase-related enzyme|nr:carboxymuconolactone decarboxylase family protein [Hydrogenophaga sp.]
MTVTSDTTNTARPVHVPTRDQVSTTNQALFDQLAKGLGQVPNLYATLAHSRHALGTYLALQNATSSITGRAREVINLVVSEVNACEYCLAAHTVIGRMHGFSNEQILEIRRGRAPFDPKLDALARFAQRVTQARGHVADSEVAALLDAGWSREQLVDTIVVIGDKTVTNYLHAVTKVPVDFPAAPALDA